MRQVIIFNTVLLGMETSGNLMARFGGLIIALEPACLAFFAVEIALKLYARGSGFSARVEACSIWSSLRWRWCRLGQALSALRPLRVISEALRLRRVVESFVTALPGMGRVFLLMAILFHIGAVIATKLFAADSPMLFGG